MIRGYRTFVLSIFHLLSNINRFSYSEQSTGKVHAYLFTSFLLCFNYLVILNKLGEYTGIKLFNEISLILGGIVIFLVNYGILFSKKHFDKAFGDYGDKRIPLYVYLLTLTYIALTVALLFL